jgi:hypothetical protein
LEGQPTARRETPIVVESAQEEARGIPLDHVTAFGGAVLLLGVVAKVLSVSRMDLTVAQVLATESSPSAIIFGALLLFFPIIPPLGMAAAILYLFHHLLRFSGLGFDTHRIVHVMAGGAAFGAFAMLGAYLVPRDFFLGALGTIAAASVVSVVAIVIMEVRGARAARRRHDRADRFPEPLPAKWRRLPPMLLALFSAAAVFQSGFTVLNDVVWLPPRHFEIDSDEAFVGYEISRTDDSVVLLREADRKIVAVSPRRLKASDPCRLVGLINTAEPLLSLASSPFDPTQACTEPPS